MVYNYSIINKLIPRIFYSYKQYSFKHFCSSALLSMYVHLGNKYSSRITGHRL